MHLLAIKNHQITKTKGDLSTKRNKIKHLHIDLVLRRLN